MLLRNLNKTKKFDPHFGLDNFSVIGKSPDNTVVTVMRKSDKMVFKRHPDDIKVVRTPQPMSKVPKKTMSEYDEIQLFFKQFECMEDAEDTEVDIFGSAIPQTQETNIGAEATVIEPRRSGRSVKPNKKYYNSNFEN